VIGKQLLTELTPLFPQIQSCSYSEAYIYNQKDSLPRIRTGVLLVTSKLPLAKSDQEKIKNWVMKRLTQKQVEVYFNRSNP
jgi:hypothetical protein